MDFLDRIFPKLADNIADNALRIVIPKVVEDLLQEIPVMEDLEEIGNKDWQEGYRQALEDVKFSLKDRGDTLIKRLDKTIKV